MEKSIIVLVCLALSTTCFGQSFPIKEGEPTIPEIQVFVCPQDGSYKSLTLFESQKAPFTGKLMTVDLAACLGTKIYSFQERCKEGLHFLDAQWRIYYNFNSKLKDIEIDYLTEAKQVCLDTISNIAIEETEWWESSPFWFSVGLLIGIVVTTSIYLGIDKL